MILVVNTGSSSIKVAIFDDALQQRLSGAADGIGAAAGGLKVGEVTREAQFANHVAALQAVLEQLEAQGFPVSRLRATAHRVVHGGARLTEPVRIDDAVVAEIARCNPLAPLHNPHNLAAINALRDLAPDLAHFASFDTAFHATNPPVATTYAVPPAITERGIRRYGFHGISYASLTRALPGIAGGTLPRRVLAFHLGNGASLCAIRDGRSVATTMGYSPLSGLTMGTRTGDIDGNAVLRMAEEDGIDAAARLLNHESGLTGLSGVGPDMRTLLGDSSPEAAFAVDHFCYWARRHAGSMIAAMEGVDALAFTGGIGENATTVRARIMEGLEWTGLVPDANAAGAARLHAPGSSVGAWVVPAAEERMIAADAAALLDADA
ncbi:acetate/propionate family kinase [Roseovarius spongiae]|uniref:acetate/propionate family kinase n=1 Tax=Roseovarius spongiae TaxID=2320272 RepID=UPI001FECD917|nr:acetate/propionate family kinase [Roseovarius spongiae]